MSTYIFALIGVFTATSWFMRFPFLDGGRAVKVGDVLYMTYTGHQRIHERKKRP